jgi:hypothetical protein
MPINKPEDPENLNIYDNFKLPDWVDPNVKFEDLPPHKQQEILDAYRFSGFRPGTYQSITGYGDALL